ncbi:MAG: ATP-dependent zinc protease [Phycisphaerales bacterium]
MKSKGQTHDGRLVVGWRERIDLPEWGVHFIRAKIDTGARTSAIHVEDIEPVGEDRVRFRVVVNREGDRSIPVEADVVRRSRVRPSHGRVQERFVVATKVQIGEVVKRIEFSLVCRQHMLCRALIGRRALDDDFFVDASRAYLVSSRKRRTRSAMKSRGSAEAG